MGPSYFCRIARAHSKFRLSSLQFLQNAAYACSVITLGTYMLGPLGFSGRQVGLVYATNALAATLAPPVTGLLADRHFSVNRMLVVTTAVAGVALTACFWATSFWVFYAGMLTFNLFFIPTFGLLASICFHQLPNPREEFPRIRAWGTVGFLVVGVGLSYFDLEADALPLVAGGVCSVLLAVYALRLPDIPPQPGFDFGKLGGDDARRFLREPGMVVLLAAMFFSCIPAAFYYSFVNPFLNEIGWGAAAAKMGIGQVGEIIILLLLPFTFRKLRFRWIVFWGLLAWGLRYFAFAYGRPGASEWLLYAGVAVQGFAFVWIVVAAQVYIDARAPTHLRSTAQGLIVMINQGLGVLLGTLLAGEVVSANLTGPGAHDWAEVWVVPGVVGVVAAVVFLFTFPRRAEV